MKYRSCDDLGDYIAKTYKGKIKILRVMQHPANEDICIVHMIPDYQAENANGIIEPTIYLYYYLPKDKAHIVAHKSTSLGNNEFKYVVDDYCNSINDDGTKTICTIDVDLAEQAADIKIADLDADKYLTRALTSLIEDK